MSMKEAFAEAMNKSVFFLGAGFSRAAGCKTSNEMLDDLQGQVTSGESELSPVQKEAVRFLLSCLDYQSKWRSFPQTGPISIAANIEEFALLVRRIKNREHLVPYPATGSWADKLVHLESSYRLEPQSEGDLFESLERFLKRRLKSEWLEIGEGEPLQYLDPLGQCIRQYHGQEFRLNVFTLNHDLVLETYFRSLDEVPWRGFY